jgi:hypothetical protein
MNHSNQYIKNLKTVVLDNWFFFSPTSKWPMSIYMYMNLVYCISFVKHYSLTGHTYEIANIKDSHQLYKSCRKLQLREVDIHGPLEIPDMGPSTWED